MKNYFICVGLLIVSAFGAKAQLAQSSENALKGPPVAKAPVTVSYIMTLKDSNDKQAKPNSLDPKQIVQWLVIKDPNLTFIEYTARNGEKGELWKRGGSGVFRMIGDKRFYILNSVIKGTAYQIDFGQYGFPHTGWVTAAKFRGKTAYQGKPVLAFGGDIHEEIDNANGPKIQSKIAMAAYVDIESRYPLVVQENTLIYTFQHLPPPTSPLTLPPAAEEVLRMEAKRINRLLGRAYSR